METSTKENIMNRIAITLLATAAALAATSARADTRISFGINLGLPAYRPVPPAVVYAPAPTVIYAPVAPRGYWKEIVVKSWVPERWVASRDRWGRMVRVCEPGYFAYRTDRVWVDHDNHGHRGHSPAPSYGHGYNRDHRNGWNR